MPVLQPWLGHRIYNRDSLAGKVKCDLTLRAVVCWTPNLSCESLRPVTSNAFWTTVIGESGSMAMSSQEKAGLPHRGTGAIGSDDDAVPDTDPSDVSSLLTLELGELGID